MDPQNHLKTRWFTIETSKNVGFGGPWNPYYPECFLGHLKGARIPGFQSLPFGVFPIGGLLVAKKLPRSDATLGFSELDNWYRKWEQISPSPCKNGGFSSLPCYIRGWEGVSILIFLVSKPYHECDATKTKHVTSQSPKCILFTQDYLSQNGFTMIYSFSQNHGSEKWLYLKGKSYWGTWLWEEG